MPTVGVGDLSKLEHPTQFEGMLSPALKIPIELATNKRLGSNIPIRGSHERNPVSGLGKLLGILPGANVGPTERVVGGKTEKGLGIDPTYSYFLDQVPFAGYLFNRRSAIRRAQNVEFGADIGYLTGLGFKDVDQEQQLLQAELAQRDRQTMQVRRLRDMGAIPEAAQTTSSYQKLIDQLLAQAYGRG